MRPEHDFPTTADAWEAEIIANAAYFTVVTFLGRGQFHRTEHDTMEGAATEARTRERPMVYAVTEAGRSAFVPRTIWNSENKEDPKS